MTGPQWIELQEQLWSAFAPLLSWFLAFLMAGLIGMASLLFGSLYFSEWLNGG
jgi:hypothetical protein